MSAIDIVNVEVRIDIVVRRNRAGIPGDINSMLCSCNIIEKFIFNTVRVAIELCANDQVESVNDSTILTLPEPERASTATADMFYDVNTLVIRFGGKESVVKPLQLRLDIVSAVQNPKVEIVAIVVVDCNDTEAWTDKHGVITALTNCSCGGRCNPVVLQPCISYSKI